MSGPAAHPVFFPELSFPLDESTRGDTRRVSAAAENVGDKRYRNHVSTAWQVFGVTDRAGRNAKLMLNARF